MKTTWYLLVDILLVHAFFWHFARPAAFTLLITWKVETLENILGDFRCCLKILPSLSSKKSVYHNKTGVVVQRFFLQCQELP